ncbi:hypothetical protein [Flexivirga alba]|uniref:Copper oxidase n=1 Tax=Flexivirga alba TaxID=702742 RepID=A0ABW2AIH5_9MICO
MNTTQRTRSVAVVAAGAAAILCMPPAGADAATSAPIRNSVAITTTGMNYHVHGGLHPGIASISWTNQDDEIHMMEMALLKPGVTQTQLATAATKGDKALDQLVAEQPGPGWGTPNLLSPGETETVTTHLRAGTYGLLCFVMGKDHMPHAAMGMVATLKVSGPAQSVAPAAAGTISIDDNGIHWPSGFTGKGTYAVRDTGRKDHALSIARLDKSVSLLQFMGSVNNTMQTGSAAHGGSLVGGVDALAAGRTAWVTLDLSAGRYGYLSPSDITGPQLPKQSGEFTLGASPTASPSVSSSSSAHTGPVVVTDGPATTGKSANWLLLAGIGAAAAAVIGGGTSVGRRLRRR